MSTVRARSALLTWGAVLFAGTLLVTACTGDPVATGTVPVTSSVVSPESLATLIPSSSPLPITPTPTPTPTPDASSTQQFSGTTVPEADASASPVTVTVQTTVIDAPPVAEEPTLTIPAGAYQNTAGGATDFIEWWFDLGVASINSGNSAVLAQYSAPSCRECGSLLQQVDEFIAEGKTVRPDGDSWAQVLQIDRSGSDQMNAVVFFQMSPQEVLEADGTVETLEDPDPYFTGLSVEWSGSHWVVAQTRALA